MEASEDASGSEQFSGATKQALFIIGFVIIMTTVLVICVKLECFKVMAAYMGFMLFMLLGFFAGSLMLDFCDAVNSTIDWPVLCFMIWNYLVVGM
jgi:uncharacterized membrane protein YfhO